MVIYFLLFYLLSPAFATTKEDSRKQSFRGRRRAYGIDGYRLFDSETSSGLLQTYGLHDNLVPIDLKNGFVASQEDSNYVESYEAPSMTASYFAEHHLRNNSSEGYSGSQDSRYYYSGSHTSSKMPKGGSKTVKSSKIKGSVRVKGKGYYGSKKKTRRPNGSSSRGSKIYQSKKSKTSFLPTLSPSLSVFPSGIPSAIQSPTIGFPTSTSSPTADDITTAAPSSLAVVSLAPYAIIYSLELTRIPRTTEFDEVASLTDEYVSAAFRTEYPTTLDVRTQLRAQSLEVASSSVIMNYTTLATLVEGDAPAIERFESTLALIFTQVGEAAYVQLLQSQLNQSNIFATTRSISFLTETDYINSTDDPASHGASFMAVIAGAASATVVAAILLLGVAKYNARGGFTCKNHARPKTYREHDFDGDCETETGTSANTAFIGGSVHIRSISGSFTTHEVDEATIWTEQVTPDLFVKDCADLLSNEHQTILDRELSCDNTQAATSVHDTTTEFRIDVPTHELLDRQPQSGRTGGHRHPFEQGLAVGEESVACHDHSRRVSELIKFFSN